MNRLEQQQQGSVVGNEPGLMFAPSDEELIEHYLRPRTTQGRMFTVSGFLIKEFDVYSVNPWELPRDFFGYTDETSEIHFFTSRNPTTRCATRASRSAGVGFWDGNSTTKPVYKKMVVGDADSKQVVIGHKTALNFKIKSGEKKIKTDWIMHEYRINNHGSADPSSKSDFDRLVVCKIHMKKSSTNNKRRRAEEEEEEEAEQVAEHQMAVGSKRMRVEEEKEAVTAPLKSNNAVVSCVEPTSSSAAASPVTTAIQAETPEVASTADWFPDEDLFDFDEIDETLLHFFDSDSQPSRFLE